MSVPDLRQRMQKWIETDYTAVLFEIGSDVVAYALYRETEDEVYLRHLWVVRNRRRQGIGREAITVLRRQYWPEHKRLTVDVLVGNAPAVAFWRAVGFKDYCLKLEITP